MEGHLKSMKREDESNEAFISPKTMLVSRRFVFRFTATVAGGRRLSGFPTFKGNSLTPAEKFLSKKEFQSYQPRSTSKR
jgi:hypothetical protein